MKEEESQPAKRPCAECGATDSHYTTCSHNHGYSSGAYAVLDVQRVPELRLDSEDESSQATHGIKGELYT